MSHKPTAYSPNFPASQGYGPPEEGKEEKYPMNPTNSYPYPQLGAMPAPPGPPLPPGAQPLPGMQHGFQPGLSPGYPQPQPGYVQAQPGYAPQPGYQFQPGYPQPIVQQPGPGGWMSIPQGVRNCPPGLEYLSMINHLFVRQQLEILEMFTGFETQNKYLVTNSAGQNVYFAVEDSGCCARNCCGSLRAFNMKIMDNFQNEVMNFYRPMKCDSCWCPCCLQTMEISAPPGNVIGSVDQTWTLCRPCFDIKDENGEVVLKIKGPLCRWTICGTVEFHVFTSDGETKIGKITKQWSGLAREIFTDADNFGINFPMDLDVKIKAVLMGACFLIDFMFYEGNKTSAGGLIV